jgi:hypothetical protein
MPITEALKKLIKTITGKNAVGETIEELVQNLNDNYPEGGSVDSELSETSENPVQNKVIAAALAVIAPYVCDVSASGFDITVNDTPESLNAAWAENREIIIIVANIRLKMTECNYTDATNYRFKFYAVNPSTNTGILETFSLIYDKTMTATLDSKDYTPTT